MYIACAVAMLVSSAVAASGAELRGSWSANSSAGATLAGTWTAEAHQESGGVTGFWTLRDAAGKILIGGSWSASKSPKSWDGAWRAMVAGSAGEYSGTWTAPPQLAVEARLFDLFESAIREVVTGTWKSGGHSGAWSIRATAPAKP